MISELQNGPFAHAPSGNFPAHAARLTPPALAFNLTRARGTLALPFHEGRPGMALSVRLALLGPTAVALLSPTARCSGAGRSSDAAHEAEHPQR
ncbi:hypothetical protein ABZ468_12475 [Streptomyces sp. NPDC005708]|uniref:hypothetical protein n=1 Tax=unclassified Streptomyces TaxID=2593676 RepID=UPI0033DC206F